MTTGKLVEQLTRHEGLRLKPYKDSVGKLTIGIGRNLDDKGISIEEAQLLLQNDIIEARYEAHRFPWFLHLNEVRQHVILNMLFNMGTTRLLGFKKMIDAIKNEDYAEAKIQMLDSKWATQVGPRATELADMMETGEYET